MGSNIYDSAQNKMMVEKCILVDERDTIMGADSKKNCHYLKGKLHRAFSVLLFNSENKVFIVLATETLKFMISKNVTPTKIFKIVKILKNETNL